MKKIICNLCGETITSFEQRFKIKVTSPFIDVRDIKAHCCRECYEQLYNFLFPRKDDEENV